MKVYKVFCKFEAICQWLCFMCKLVDHCVLDVIDHIKFEPNTDSMYYWNDEMKTPITGAYLWFKMDQVVEAMELSEFDLGQEEKWEIIGMIRELQSRLRLRDRREGLKYTANTFDFECKCV